MISRDLRYALRAIPMNPGFSLTMVVVLGLGIGATTGIFSVIKGVVLDPLPFPDSERMVVLWQSAPGSAVERDWFSPVQYYEILEQTSAFETLAIAAATEVTVTGPEGPERLGLLSNSANLFDLLGARPHVGRLFSSADDDGGAAAVAVLSHRLWKRRFDSDPEVVGKTVTLDGGPVEVIGVLNEDAVIDGEVLPSFATLGDYQIFRNLPQTPNFKAFRGEDYNVLGILRPGVGIGEVRAQVDIAAAQFDQGNLVNDPAYRVLVFPLLEDVVGDTDEILTILLVSTSLLLLISCANAANLLLSRAASRQRDLAVRSALGAGRGMLVRQLLLENLVLAFAGGALGVVLATWGVAALKGLSSEQLPRLNNIAVDLWVLAFALSVSVAACLIFGFFPALKASSFNLDTSLRGRSGVATGASLRTTWSLPNGLVAAEVALSLALLVGAGLLVRSYGAVSDVDTGFEVDSRFTFRVSLAGPSFGTQQARREFFTPLWERLGADPSVNGAGGVSLLPLSPGMSWGDLDVEGVSDTDDNMVSDFRVVTRDYFDVMEIDLAYGRMFQDGDGTNERVVIVDRTLADRFWPDGDAIGHRVGFNPNSYSTIVGVVEPVRHYELESFSRMTMYFPYSGFAVNTLYGVVESSASVEHVTSLVRNTVKDLDPDVPVYSVSTLSERFGKTLARRALVLRLFQLFAFIAFAQAVIGVYGVLSHRVSITTKEIGMRVALGATRTRVINLVLSQGMKLVALGLVSGVVLAFLTAPYLGTLLFGVDGRDPVTFLVVSFALSLVGGAACYLPARRACKLSPMEALKD